MASHVHALQAHVQVVFSNEDTEARFTPESVAWFICAAMVVVACQARNDTLLQLHLRAYEHMLRSIHWAVGFVACSIRIAPMCGSNRVK